MKVACTILAALALLQGTAFAQAPAPEIEVVDGKVSMSVQAMPLSRLLSLLDRAMGLTSQVKPELANRTVSVRFSGLVLKDAVHKIFEGQPFNYMLIEGKGIRVTDLAQGGPSTSSASSTPFQDSGPINQPPINPINQPLPGVSPIQQPVNAVSPTKSGRSARTGHYSFWTRNESQSSGGKCEPGWRHCTGPDAATYRRNQSTCDPSGRTSSSRRATFQQGCQFQQAPNFRQVSQGSRRIRLHPRHSHSRPVPGHWVLRPAPSGEQGGRGKPPGLS